MAGVEVGIGRAVAAHRQAAAILAAVEATLTTGDPRAATTERGIRELAERLRAAAARLAPEWLGAPLDAVPASMPLGATSPSGMVRIGTAYPLDDAGFPVVVPLGHLAVDGDARDPRVAGMLRAVVLRLLAQGRPGGMRVRVVDAAGGIFAPFAALFDAGIMAPPVADRPGLCAVLTEAEEWVRSAPASPDRHLLVIASWPLATEPIELSRISALASAGPAAGLQLVLAGWPPLLLGEDSTEPVALGPEAPALPLGRGGPPLPHATRITLRNPYALVGHPPDGSFAADVPAGQTPSAGLNARVFLDESPPAELISRVSGDLAATVLAEARVGLGEALPEGPLWTGTAAAGLEVEVGRADREPVTVRLSESSPHCLVVGEQGSGKTALLLSTLYGLCGRYSPDQLHCYLLDFSDRPSFAEFVPQPGDPTFLPHAQAVGVTPSREDALAVLRALVAELATRPAGQVGAPPRLLCVADELDGLLTGGDELATEAGTLLASLARDGGARGVHLLLAGRSLPPAAVAEHCRVRIALPGGMVALDPANRAADEIPLGVAVVNTAGGLGGPPRARRAHERRVRFPDPTAYPAPLAGLRYRLWRAGSARTRSGP